MPTQYSTDREWTETMEKTSSANEQHHRDRGLLMIGLFKLGKAIFFFFLGMGAIHLLHKDLGDEIMRLARELRFDP
ncbi:MAG TPA: DUF2127 domain-containing protein, partial [Bryobacteraceae bacterium]